MAWIAVHIGIDEPEIAMQKIEFSLAKVKRRVKDMYAAIQNIGNPAKRTIVCENKIPGYIFIKCDLDDQLWHAITSAKGLFEKSQYKYNILGPVTDAEIEIIKAQCQDAVQFTCPDGELSFLKAMQAKFRELVLVAKKKVSLVRLPLINLPKHLNKLQSLYSEIASLPEYSKEPPILANIGLAL